MVLRWNSYSDVDFALVSSKKLSPKERLELELKIEVDLSDFCNITNPDVRIINDAPLVIKGKIVQQGVLIYCNNEARRVEFET
jgi:predicted nucleotidyltransferase